MIRRRNEEDLTDENLSGSSNDDVFDYKTKSEVSADEYIRSREKAKALLDGDENIMWEGRPNFEWYFEKLKTLRFIAIIWAAIDIPMMLIFLVLTPFFVKIIMLLFFSIHLMPVWIYIASVYTKDEVKNSLYYMLTNKKIIVSYYKGVYTTEWESVGRINFERTEGANNVGSIYFNQYGTTTNGSNNKSQVSTDVVNTKAFVEIDDFDEVCKIISEFAPLKSGYNGIWVFV